MTDKKKNKRINSGALIDSALYRKLQIAAAEDGIKVGHMMDMAIKFFLDNRRKWPDDIDNQERE